MIRKVTKKTKENRYQSAEAMLEDLRKLAEGRGVPASGTRRVSAQFPPEKNPARETVEKTPLNLPYGWFYAGAAVVGLAVGVVLNFCI